MTLVQKEPKEIYVWTTPVKKVYVWTTKVRPAYKPITTPWIYHNSDLWLISLSSDWTNWTTIADKNLGATSTDITSTESYGNYYQRGNNYWFPNSWSVTSSSTTVNAGTYWPWNYYSSSTFIKNGNNWDSSNNNNLWGDTTNTLVARQWPCGAWFHVPTRAEFVSLYNIYTALGQSWSTNFMSYFKLSLAWYRRNDNSNADAKWSTWFYWSSSVYQTTTAYLLRFTSSAIEYQMNRPRSQWFSVRPFKNETVQPREWDERVALYSTWLKSYEEICAMTYSNAATELNRLPQEYYNKFNSEWHIVIISGNQFFDHERWSARIRWNWISWISD